MNLSDSSSESSSDESSTTRLPKRRHTNTSSPAAHGSAGSQESDDESTKIPNYNYTPETKRVKYQEAEYDRRLSRSSVSENWSSPDRPAFEEDIDNGEGSIRSTFQNSHDNCDNVDSNYSKDIQEKIKEGYSNKAQKMMSKMGFIPGKGLGKKENGRIEPVEASTQKGRRGLGLKPSIVGEIPQDFKWSPDDEKPDAKEEVCWMPLPPEEPISGDILEEWLEKGPKKLTIDDETEFVNAHILKGILDSKTIFDSLDDEDLRNARFRSNPYETIGSVMFLNRAAVKMANMDAVFNFMFTKPKKPNGSSAIDKKEILYFADVCAGPGGFSEYVLYRKGWKAKGFGFTLKGANDFKLSDFYAGTPETFNPYYGEKEDGNIFNPANLMSLKKNVLKETDDKGVHFLMADGGFSVEGQENIQEILSKQLYLCQCLAALMLVRTGGCFVVKLFDVFTLFSVGLIYIMYRCFEKVSIHKPVTSRPANSERYLVCMWKKLGTESAEQHLFNVNSILWEKRDSEDDVVQLVPLSVIQEDRGFYEYIYKSNCVLGEKQIKNLLKIAAFSKDKTLKESCQAEMREQCLKLWQLPDKVRTQPEWLNPDNILSNIMYNIKKPHPESNNLHSLKSNILCAKPDYLLTSPDLEKFKNVYEWHFVFLSGKSNNDLRFFIGCGGKQVYQLDGFRWKNVVGLHLTLPAKTLLYGEVVKEWLGEGSNQMFNRALHVIDAVMLGGVDISHLPLTERINQCILFCTALNKPFDPSALPIRCKRLSSMETFPSAMNNLEIRAMKKTKQAVTLSVPYRINRIDMFYEIGSILFMKELKEPWVATISKSSGHKYYYKPGSESEYFIPEEARMDTLGTYSNRIMWSWENAACAILNGRPHEGVTKAEMEHYIRCNVNK